ncbi:hypothetical protein BACCIP111895_03867 [Neobacillus rhizosphaerae]|uniref:Resolvase/invertase-type recombinase catalytic domain-containing protein n=1 Tax=Neobacillus rhizosphaerae TaxID=2880965 RepID=A0ABM9EVF6_9BACI|nr:hypothetical protein BACCIP111895_03867 [Neobacillus rhizosphaerae]
MCKGQSERIVLFAVQKGNLEEMASKRDVLLKGNQKRGSEKGRTQRLFFHSLLLLVKLKDDLTITLRFADIT